MSDYILAHEPAIRLGFFLGVFALMALWEVLAPRRALTQSRAVRWGNNLGLVFLNSFVLRVLFPAAAVGMAAFAAGQGWGAFNYFDVPFWLAVLVSVVILDFFIWLHHHMLQPAD